MKKKTSLEDEIMQLQAEATAVAQVYRNKIETLRKKLADACKHTKTADYEWEHDNGYGRQKMIVGEQCLACQRQRSWKNTGSWFLPEWVK